MAVIAQEGELNSSSNNSEVKAADQDQNVIIEYEYEPEPDDYNYVAPDTPIDEEEFRQLTYTGNTTDNSKVIKAVIVVTGNSVEGNTKFFAAITDIRHKFISASDIVRIGHNISAEYNSIKRGAAVSLSDGIA